jgi:hypothetical protein
MKFRITNAYIHDCRIANSAGRSAATENNPVRGCISIEKRATIPHNPVRGCTSQARRSLRPASPLLPSSYARYKATKQPGIQYHVLRIASCLPVTGGLA